MIISIFILLLLINSYSTINSNIPGCTILTIYCRADPTCLDENVFLEKCLLKNDLRISSWIDNAAFSHAESLENEIWQKFLLEDFQEQLQNQQLDQITQRVLQEQFSEDIQSFAKLVDKRNKEKEKLLELFDQYQKESIRESKRFKLQKEKNREEDLENNKHLSILSDTYDRLFVLFHELKRNLKEKTLSNSLAENNTSINNITTGPVVTNTVENRIIRISVDSESSSNPLFQIVNRDNSSEKRDDKSIEDIKDKGYLTIKTTQRLNISSAVKFVHQLQILLWNIQPSKQELLHIHKISNNLLELHLTVDSSSDKKIANTTILADLLNKDKNLQNRLKESTGIIIKSVIGSRVNDEPVALISEQSSRHWNRLTVFTTVIGVCTIALFIIAATVFVLRRNNKGNPVNFKKQEAVQDYQELCRTQMSVVNATDNETEKDGNMKGNWNEDSFPYNMDITTGHVILSYMEDHLKNEDRLNFEWKALCSYKADDATSKAGSSPKNSSKNRYRDVLPFDHTRVKLHETSNTFHSDYINASFIADVNPHRPEYIATQGPLDNTVADFWQMIWEHGIAVIVNLTKLSDVGLPQCHRYWPESGNQVYHIYEVNLISEHIWCDDYLVRSLYLKNLQTGETRTITQFHYLTWPDLSVPSSPKPLLEFRRKVNKCYRGHACPIIVHCNNGVGRTGTYILLDMVLNKMIKGAKEMDIAASLEHIRDQRPDMVKTKGQFEFVLTAVADEVTTILSSVPQ